MNTTDFLRLIIADENGALIMMFAAFCFLFYQEYREAKHDSIRRVIILQMICSIWMLLLYAADIPSYLPEVMACYHRHSIVSLSLNLMIIPLCHITLSLMTKRHEYSTRWALIHIAPYIVATLLGFFTNSRTIYYTILGLSLIYSTYFLITTTLAVRRYDRAAEDEFSSLDGRSFRWLIVAPNLLGLLLVAFILYCIYKNVLWLIVYQALSIAMWGNYFYGSLKMIHERNQMTGDPDKEDEMMLENDNENDNENQSEFAAKLKAVCEDTEMYLNRDLTREDLAHAMGTNHTYLSRNLQEELGMNFYTYINILRVARAKELMAEHPDWSMEHIAIACGYRSRATFQNTYERITGERPLDWKERQLTINQ